MGQTTEPGIDSDLRSAASHQQPLQRVVIWGASLSGEECLRQCRERGIEVLYFVDRRAAREDEFLGTALRPVAAFLADDPGRYDAIFLAMGVDPSGPTRQIRDAGITKPVLSFRKGGQVETSIERVLCPNRLLAFDGGPEDARVLDAIAGALSERPGPLALYGAGRLARALLAHRPALRPRIAHLVDDAPALRGTSLDGLRVDDPAVLDGFAGTIFVASLRFLSTTRMRERAEALCGRAPLVVSEILAALPVSEVPARAWIAAQPSIYPIELPRLELAPGLDVALFDLPPRFFCSMPNGLAYVHDVVAATGARLQTVDVDLVFYHRWHSQRIFDGLEEIVAPTGHRMKQDPWAIDVIWDEWEKPEMRAWFEPWIAELVEAVVAARPKIVGFSLHGTNLDLTKEVVRRIRAGHPDVIVLAGGYDCISPELGPRVFEDFDYMVIFEAEMSLPGLLRELLQGRRPASLPGVISKHDRPEIGYRPAPLLTELDALGFPRYPWAKIRDYRNWNGYQMTPIVLSRGCRWSKCTFCAERFSWRRREPACVVDEIAWLREQGCTNFVFNDSDLSGDPTAVRAICEELMRRGIDDVALSGQLRVQKGYTQEYFDVLHRAGFKSLNYGIDGWSKSTLRLHRKGYTLAMIEEVLGFTKRAGISVSVNLVIGIPHETEADVDETIENVVRNAHLLDGIDNLNTLILSTNSLYWAEPEKHGIVLRGPKEELYARHPKRIPTELWYSTDPYIDQAVRLDRVRRIVEAARRENVRISSYAAWSLERHTSVDDGARAPSTGSPRSQRARPTPAATPSQRPTTSPG